MSSQENLPPLSVAVIGMAGRFPGAPDIDSFWQNLLHGCSGGRVMSEQQDDLVHYGFPLDNIELFDANFFDMSPRESALTDPQHRIFLECAFSALEHAGIAVKAKELPIGVFASCNFNTYLFNVSRGISMTRPTEFFDVVIGNDKDYLASRVSYKLNLTGPAMAVQTACSSSLTAVSIACQSLLNGQCDTALAGGVGIRADQQSGYYPEQDGALSDDGLIRSFSDDATGVNEGNGVGIVVLKRLEDAVQDNDVIYAVVRGYAVNNDGANKAGFSAPSVSGQSKAIVEALSMADISAESIGYIETHGTGTPIGDPIEFAALKQAWADRDPNAPRCVLGAVKTGIGHLNAAAGIAGFIKTVLTLHHKTIPSSLNFHQPNPQLDIVNSPFEIATETRPWKRDVYPRRAAISAFGLGGVNVHVILEEAPSVTAPLSSSSSMQPLLLSARTEKALLNRAQQLSHFFETNPDCDLEAVAQTLAFGRHHMSFRSATFASSPQHASELLSSPSFNKKIGYLKDIHRKTKVSFIFPGAGSQYAGMGISLYQNIPLFKQHFDQCHELFNTQKNIDLLVFLDRKQDLNQSIPGMCALFAIEYALAQTLMCWGITPDSLIGHSLGEYSAAAVSGVFTLETAAHLVWSRASLIDQTAHGSMIVVPLSEQNVTPYLTDDISIAAITSPNNCVLSGPVNAMTELMAQLEEQKIAFIKISVDKAGHSSTLNPILDKYRAIVENVKLYPPSIPIVSNVSGGWLTAHEATNPDYWVRQLRNPVRLSDGLTLLGNDEKKILIEIGPGQQLSVMARKHPCVRGKHCVISTMSLDTSKKSDFTSLQESLGNLWVAGGFSDWRKACFAGASRKVIALPTYPFEGNRHWIEKADIAEQPVNTSKTTGFYAPVWREILSTASVEQEGSILLLTDTKTTIDKVLIERLTLRGWHVQQITHTDELRVYLSKGECTPDVLIDCRATIPLMATTDAFSVLRHVFYDNPVKTGSILAELLPSKNLDVIFIARGICQVTGEERCDPVRSMLLGPCRVLPFEAPTVNTLTLDVAVDATDNDIIAGVISLLDNKQNLDTPLSLMAIRHRKLWVQDISPLQINEKHTDVIVIRDYGVYLIFGGSGGIGFTLMSELADQAKRQCAHITFIPVQRNMPDDSLWKPLRDTGAHVIPVASDIGNMAQMKTSIASCETKYGSIVGIIHAAGVSGGGLMQVGAAQEKNSNFAAKIKGVLCLDELFAGRCFDFVVLCSSLGVFSGTIGQVDNTAANAVLDAWAAHNHLSEETKVISINWDVWQEVGMINELGHRHYRITGEKIANGFSPEQARHIFPTLLTLEIPQVAVSIQPLDEMLANIRAKRAKATGVFEQANLTNATDQENYRPDLSVAYRAPRHDLDRCILTIFEERLGIREIGIDDDYVELGGDSLLAMPLTAAIRDTFQVPFAVALLFKTRTIAHIADYLIALEDGPTRIVPFASILQQVRSMTTEQINAELKVEKKVDTAEHSIQGINS